MLSAHQRVANLPQSSGAGDVPIRPFSTSSAGAGGTILKSLGWVLPLFMRPNGNDRAGWPNMPVRNFTESIDVHPFTGPRQQIRDLFYSNLMYVSVLIRTLEFGCDILKRVRYL